MKQNFPSIKKKSVEELIPYVNNSRTHSDEQVSQVAASIKEFGFTNPILIDGDNGIIAGHGRLMAAKKLGLKEVPTIELSHLTETQKKAYIIADNKLALNAGWDDELLRVEIEDLEIDGFDVGLLGFNADELAEISFDAEEIEEVDHFNESYNIAISCEDNVMFEKVKSALCISGKKIQAEKLLEVIR